MCSSYTICTAVRSIDESCGGIAVRCCEGAIFEAGAAILTVPPPLLSEIDLPVGRDGNGDGMPSLAAVPV